MLTPVTRNNSTSEICLTHMRITADKHRMFHEFKIITAGQFLHLCDQTNSNNMGPILNGYCVMGAFQFLLTHSSEPHVCTCRGIIQYVTMNRWKWIPGLSPNFHTWYSQLSSNVSCNREWDFWKPVLSIAECKFKAVSFMKLNLIINLSDNVFIVLLHICSVIITFYSKFKAVKTQ